MLMYIIHLKCLNSVPAPLGERSVQKTCRFGYRERAEVGIYKRQILREEVRKYAIDRERSKIQEKKKENPAFDQEKSMNKPPSRRSAP